MKLLLVSLVLSTFLFLIKSDSMPVGGSWSFTGPILDLYKGKKNVVVLTPGAGTTRSAAEQQGRSVVSRFKTHGIQAEWLDLAPPNCKVQANNPALAKKIRDSDAVFIGGGYSDVYQECFFGGETSGTSKVLEALVEAAKKKLVGGSSAGAMVQPHKDILLTRRPVSSYQAVVGINIPKMDGSKLFDIGLVDSHFSERGRQGRLFVHAFKQGARFSYGVDEDSAVIELTNKDKEKLFLGARGVVVFDHRNKDLQNGRMHYLTQGDRLLADGTIIYPAWKTPCALNNRSPTESRRIFTEFKMKSFQVALFDKNIRYSGLEGVNPTVEVIMQKLNETQVMCGTFQGKGYVSYSNMFVSMAKKTLQELNGRTGLPHINKEPEYIDD
jgi:cyanophycinase-like exopeptidase